MPNRRPWHLGAGAGLLIPRVFGTSPDDICIIEEYVENKLTSLHRRGTP